MLSKKVGALSGHSRHLKRDLVKLQSCHAMSTACKLPLKGCCGCTLLHSESQRALLASSTYTHRPHGLIDWLPACRRRMGGRLACRGVCAPVGQQRRHEGRGERGEEGCGGHCMPALTPAVVYKAQHMPTVACKVSLAIFFRCSNKGLFGHRLWYLIVLVASCSTTLTRPASATAHAPRCAPFPL